MPTLTVPLGPADLEGGGMGLREGATVAGVWVVATDEVGLAAAMGGFAEVDDVRDVEKGSPLGEVDDWSCVNIYAQSRASLPVLTSSDETVDSPSWDNEEA